MAPLRHPQILIASDLLLGDVVFLGASGWVRDCRRARVARDQAAAAALEALAKSEMQSNRVVEAYLADAALDADGAPTLLHYRERLRALGPSVRRDLGKQAARQSSGDAK